MTSTKIVAVVSGGLDSTTLLYDYANSSDTEVVQALSFNYGQRHKKELDYAQATCEKLHIPWTLIDLWSSGLPDLLASSESSLISSADVPEGHYAESNMKSTVVPNRNMIMLSIAGGVMVALHAHAIATAVHAGDHFIYPDCRPRFIRAANAAIAFGNESFGAVPPQHEGAYPTQVIETPFLYSTKADIAQRALQLNVPLNETWSCYKGGEHHCGRCGTCVERLEAIAEAQGREHLAGNIPPADTTIYEDKNFWRQAIANV